MSRPINIGGTIFMSCFICDQATVGERRVVAQMVTLYTKQNFAQKICNLMGEGHVVVATSKDVICGKCCDLVNKMDKIEVDLDNARSNVLNIIGKTYRLDGNTASSEQIPKIEVPRLKIYKCGFCSYQSKELNDVRVHMRVHVDAQSAKQNPALPKQPPKQPPMQPPMQPPKQPPMQPPKQPPKQPPMQPPKPPPMQPPNQPPMQPPNQPPMQPPNQPPKPESLKRRIFRCQVCSAMYDTKEECLQHIGMNHATPAPKTNTLDSDANKSLREYLQAGEVDKKGKVGSGNVKKQSNEAADKKGIGGDKLMKQGGQVVATGEGSKVTAGKKSCGQKRTAQESKGMDMDAILVKLGKKK